MKAGQQIRTQPQQNDMTMMIQERVHYPHDSEGWGFLVASAFLSVGGNKGMYKTCVMLYYYIAFEAEKSSPQQMENDARIKTHVQT